MSIPETDQIKPRPVMARHLRRLGGLPVGPPTEEEKWDAIRVLEAAPTWENLDEIMSRVSSKFGVTPRSLELDALVDEAELIHHEASLQ